MTIQKVAKSYTCKIIHIYRHVHREGGSVGG